jgi:predicted Zn-dependent peptidase
MEQATFVLGMPSFARNDPRRFALGVVNAVLGGGTSSRLFQEVRETRGLAYTIYSFTSQHVDAGYFAVAGGCMPTKLPQVLDICRDVLARVVDEGLDAEELLRGKGQMRGGLVMGLEDSSARMTRIGKSELVPGGLLGTDETLALIDAVTLDDVREAAAAVLTGARPSPSSAPPKPSPSSPELPLFVEEPTPGPAPACPGPFLAPRRGARDRPGWSACRAVIGSSTKGWPGFGGTPDVVGWNG